MALTKIPGDEFPQAAWSDPLTRQPTTTVSCASLSIFTRPSPEQGSAHTVAGLLGGWPAHLRLRRNLGRDLPLSIGLLTGRSQRGVRNALTDLVGEGVLRVVEEHRGSRPAELEINTDYRSWGRFTVKREPHHRGQEAILAAPALEGSSRTPLEGRPGTPTKDRKITESSGGATKAPRQAGFYPSPSDLLALVQAAQAGKGFDPRLPAELREAIRSGAATLEMIDSFAQDEEGSQPWT